jgi:SAM-dependent methyltransferase
MTSHLRELLNVFWLRPETAMWRACDIQAMAPFNFTSPSLDLGCGDGIFSFVRAGGQLGGDFDAFRSMGNLDKFFQNADVFDHYNHEIDVGFDHKRALLNKAEELGLYSELRLGDGNGALPFVDKSFRTVFSNIVYWLNDPAFSLGEIRRILVTGGQACLLLPDSTLPDFSFYNRYYKRSGDQRFQFLDLLDRGRLSDNIKHGKSDKEWRALFEAAGLSVASHVQHLSGTIVQIWDVGLRPLFPVLKKMTDRIESSELLPLKREWIEICHSFVAPLVALDADLAARSAATFHCYTLERR